MFIALTIYLITLLYPVILDKIQPINGTRQRAFVSDGEYIVDKYDYYPIIYLLESFVCTVSVVVITTMDSMFAVIIEHCIGLIAITK